MTQEQLNALVALLQRAPMTPAEALWAQGLLEQLQQQVAALAAMTDEDRKLMRERGWSLWHATAIPAGHRGGGAS